MGMGGFGGGPATNKRYNLTLSVYSRNIFNYTNAGNITGVLNSPNPSDPASVASISPFFGRANTLAAGPYSTNGASRLVYLQLGFTF